jgi:hypothetical protein
VLRLRAKKRHRSQMLLLMELVVAKVQKKLPISDDGGQSEVPLLSVEWLLLQDPTASFSLERPQLPGQDHPGLGISEEIQELLVQVCRRLSLEGIYDRPSHYHNAFVTRRTFHFVEPREEGRFLAIGETVAGLPIPEATALVEDPGLVLADGTAVYWTPADHIMPLSDRLRRYFESDAYLAARDVERARLHAAGLAQPVDRAPKRTR